MEDSSSESLIKMEGSSSETNVTIGYQETIQLLKEERKKKKTKRANSGPPSTINSEVETEEGYEQNGINDKKIGDEDGANNSSGENDSRSPIEGGSGGGGSKKKTKKKDEKKVEENGNGNGNSNSNSESSKSNSPKKMRPVKLLEVNPKIDHLNDSLVYRGLVSPRREKPKKEREKEFEIKPRRRLSSRGSSEENDSSPDPKPIKNQFLSPSSSYHDLSTQEPEISSNVHLRTPPRRSSNPKKPQSLENILESSELNVLSRSATQNIQNITHGEIIYQ